MQPPGEGNYCASYERLHMSVCSSCCQQQVSTHLTYQAFYSPSFICFHHPLPCALVFINGSGGFFVCIGFLFLLFFFLKRPEFVSLMEHLGGGHSSYLLHSHCSVVAWGGPSGRCCFWAIPIWQDLSGPWFPTVIPDKMDYITVDQTWCHSTSSIPAQI